MSQQRAIQEEPAGSSWLAPPERLDFDAEQVHVWRTSLDMAHSGIKTLQQWLSTDELVRAHRFHREEDRDRFIAARGLLRLILGRYAAIRPGELRFCYGPYGKPQLAEDINGKSIRFNVSHSHRLALCAVTQGREIGVDLEYLRPDLIVEDFMDERMPSWEICPRETFRNDSRLTQFFTYWTRKEACLKALGTGLALGLNPDRSLRTVAEGASILAVLDESHRATYWTLKDLDAGPGYAAALAVEGCEHGLKCTQWQGDLRHFV